MRYRLFYPTKDERGSNMLDYIMGERPETRTYEFIEEGYTDARADMDTEGANLRDRALNAIWSRYQRHDRNPLTTFPHRSMCVGDIVHFPGLNLWFVCEAVGWREMPADEVARITFQVTTK